MKHPALLNDARLIDGEEMVWDLQNGRGHVSGQRPDYAIGCRDNVQLSSLLDPTSHFYAAGWNEDQR